MKATKRLYLDKKGKVTDNPEKAEFLYCGINKEITKKDLTAHPEIEKLIEQDPDNVKPGKGEGR